MPKKQSPYNGNVPKIGQKRKPSAEILNEFEELHSKVQRQSKNSLDYMNFNKESDMENLV